MSGIETKAIVEINQAANRFRSSIVLRVQDKYVDAKSILGLTISMVRDETYRLEIHGPDEREARTGMLEVFGRHGLKVENGG